MRLYRRAIALRHALSSSRVYLSTGLNVVHGKV